MRITLYDLLVHSGPALQRKKREVWVTLDRELVKGGTSRKKGRNRIEKTKEREKKGTTSQKKNPSNPGDTLCGRKKNKKLEVEQRTMKQMDVRFLLQVEKLQISRYVQADKFML